jgi:8-oxo-dGTP pyrophosphatase MutT (NUDIX family)
MPQKWNRKSSSFLQATPVFKLRTDVLINPRTKKELNAFVLESRDWINIVPITPDNKVVLVKQYRFGTESFTLEVPGGLADDTDESMAHAARRELNEETGYDSDEIITLGKVNPNPAILNNHLHIFAATHVKKVSGQSLDDGEDIEIELIPYDDIPALVQNGTIAHALVLNAFYLYDLHCRNNTK